MLSMATDPSYSQREPDWLDETRPAETGVARRIPRFDPVNPGHVRLRRLERLAWLLDRSIPVGKFRIGLDPILGLMPGVGDAIGALLSLYVLYEGARLGAPAPILVRMAGNIVVETILGAVPVLGDVFDFVWQANSRNLRLLHRHHAPGWRPRSLRSVWIAVAMAAVLVLSAVIALAWAVVDAAMKLLERATG
jgi:hypothetical protein